MKIVAAGLAVLILAGCQTGPKETAGTLLGAAGGAVLGAQVGKGKGQLVGVAVGTLAGAFIGGQIGKSMDDVDRLISERHAQKALETSPTGYKTEWVNPETGNWGTVTPQRTFQSSGTYCREYQTTIVVHGVEERGYGTACRQPDGSWRIQS